MNSQITEYLASKKYAWAQTTIRSETHRLNSVAHMLDGNPETLWLGIQNKAPYTRLTIWTRVTDFHEWLVENNQAVGLNPYKAWRKKNAKVFKNVYVKSKPSQSYSEAVTLINTISEDDIRRRALEIIGSGLRYNESTQCSEGTVNGKGSKRRDVFRPRIEGKDYSRSYQTFRRALAKIGLNPHDLRKLFLTRLVELGANEFELCEIAGWSSISTASSYIKVNSDKTRRLVEMVHGGINNGRQHPNVIAE